MVHAKEDVERVDERALARTGPRELPRLSEIDLVSTLVLKDPETVAAVLASEPRAHVVVKYGWIAAVADGIEDASQVVDDGGELVEVGGDAAVGDGVVNECLVERLLHEVECGDAGELDSGRGEEEVFFVGRPGEEGHRADLAVDLAPVVEHGVRIGDDWGKYELAGNGE